MFYHSASPLLGEVLQLRQLVKVVLLGCRSYFALPSATDARSGDKRRKSPPPLAPLAALVPLRVAVSTLSATLRQPYGCGGSFPTVTRLGRAVFLFVRCAANAAPLFLLISHNFTKIPTKIQVF